MIVKRGNAYALPFALSPGIMLQFIQIYSTAIDLYIKWFMIDRCILKTVENTRKHFPCVLLSGPRQVGKSTLVRNIYEGNGYHYVSLDDTLERNLAKGDPRTFLSVHSWSVVIDEAQKAPELFPEIERIINEERSVKGNKLSSGMLIITGSS